MVAVVIAADLAVHFDEVEEEGEEGGRGDSKGDFVSKNRA